MKTLVSILALVLVGYVSSAQTLTMAQVPAACSQGFKTKFPNGFQPGWSKAGADIYEVQFFNGKKRQSALFDGTGKWMQTQTEINYGAIPAKVQNAFAKEFDGYMVQEVYETIAFEREVTYEVTAFKGAANFRAVFSAKGDLLKKEEGMRNE